MERVSCKVGYTICIIQVPSHIGNRLSAAGQCCIAAPAKEPKAANQVK